MQWEKHSGSDGTYWEGELAEPVEFAILSSESTLQLLFHQPLLLLRKSLKFENCRVFGDYRSFSENRFLAKLGEFLANELSIYFSLYVKGKSWSLYLRSEYEGEILDAIDQICDSAP